MKKRKKISADQALEILNNNKPLVDIHVLGILDLRDFGKTNKIVKFHNCFIENLKASCVCFLSEVVIENSEFIKCNFTFTYFVGGLLITNCVFYNIIDFSSGGHNNIKNVLCIKDTIFHEYVSFENCYYNGPVKIINNDFIAGTDLNATYNVNYDVPPIINDNKGNLDSLFLGLMPNE